VEIHLRAEQTVRIRRLTEADRDKIRVGFALLGERTLYERFGRVPKDPRRTLEWVDRLRDSADVALGACECPAGEPVGLARYVRSAATSAELAVTVVDARQGQGIGGALLRALCRVARREGLTTLAASILLENHRALRLIQSVGGRRSGPTGAGLVQYTVELEPEDQPPPAGTAAAHHA
jgi:GNAT superfamily N-acetyltransferase